MNGKKEVVIINALNQLINRSFWKIENGPEMCSQYESILFSDEKAYAFSPQQIELMQFELIRDAFQYHYHNNALYRRYCDQWKVNSRTLSSWRDLGQIPLLPSSVFKSMDISSVPAGMIVKKCVSSGTMGGRSLVNRDLVSLERIIGSIKKSVEELTTIKPDAIVLNLSPGIEESGDLWIAYVLNMLSFLFETRYYIKNNTFAISDIIHDIQQLREGQQTVIVGPPHLILSMAEYIHKNRIRMDFSANDNYIITAGGWKRHVHLMIDRKQFNEQVRKAFGMSNTYGIRDCLNLVELNSVIFECEQQCKHLPPWLLVRILDPDTLQEVKDGEEGLIAYLDPMAQSYPGFVLSDDFGYINPLPCKCGSSGRLLNITRRVARVEDRGCALKMDRDIERI